MKEIRRDFTVVAEVPDYIGVDEVEITITAVASYAEQTVEPKVLAEEPYVVEPEPPEVPKPKCPKCGEEIEFLNVYWPATVSGTAEFSNDGLNVEFVDGVNDLEDIAKEDEQVYCCPHCEAEFFKAGQEAEVAAFLQGSPDAKPQYGTWTTCSCGHIAQEHDKTGKCERVGCACLKYDGMCIPAES